MGIEKKLKYFNSLRLILFELCKRDLGLNWPTPAGIGLNSSRVYILTFYFYTKSYIFWTRLFYNINTHKGWVYRDCLELFNYFFEKPLKNACRNVCHTLIFVFLKKIIFLTLYYAFFPPFLAPKLLKLSVLFFSFTWPLKIGLWTRISTLCLLSKAFFWGGGAKRPPPGYT